jgi:hypothetical protein
VALHSSSQRKWPWNLNTDHPQFPWATGLIVCVSVFRRCPSQCHSHWQTATNICTATSIVRALVLLHGDVIVGTWLPHLQKHILSLQRGRVVNISWFSLYKADNCFSWGPEVKAMAYSCRSCA